MSYIDISNLIGVPFKSRGRSIHDGFDCWGLVIEVFRRININLPDFYIDAYDSFEIDKTRNIFESNWEKVKKPDMGIVIGLNFDRMAPDITQHFGVCLDNRKFIHVVEGSGVIITQLNHAFFKNIIAGYYKWKL